MPNYEYMCDSCGYRFEQRQGINDKPIDRCPECGQNVRRLISGGSGIIFKGSGFHATDYRKNNQSAGPCCSTGQGCDQPKRCCDQS